MPNTVDSALVPNDLADSLLSPLTQRLAFLEKFCTLSPTGPAPAKDSQTIIATVLPAVATDASDFETGDMTLDNRPATVHLYSISWGLSAQEIGGGLSAVALAQAAAEKLADKIIDVVLAPVTASNYAAATVTATAALFAVTDFDTLWSAISAPDKAVVLDGAHFCKVKPAWIPPGFSNVFENSRWSGAETKVRGFVAAPRAVVVRHGLPIPPPERNAVQRQVLTIPGVGLPVELTTWCSRGPRSVRCSLQLFLGAGVGDSSALRLLKIP
jgi:hypothetical protein